MQFRLRKKTGSKLIPDTVYLTPSNWDDWFKFSTLFSAFYVDQDSRSHGIGQVKVGQFGLQPASSSEEPREGHRSPDLADSFASLLDSQFSLGQDTSYYEALTEIGSGFRDRYLISMNDLAYDSELLNRAEKEAVTGVSLLRDVPLATVQEQYARLARGGARLTPYKLAFKVPQRVKHPVRLSFEVNPNSRPPTNIHVLIGRNGVGKSTILNSIAQLIVDASQEDADRNAGPNPWEQLSNLVSVSFSAFDAFEPISVPRDRTKLTYHYVGLKKIATKKGESGGGSTTKDHKALSSELTRAVKTCLLGARRSRLHRAIHLLEGDPIFAAMRFGDLLAANDDDEILSALSLAFKDRLSSGHKIVLLTVAKLVETVEEKSLVLLDEPEAHLHPPLLSAFVRTLSDLLTNRNGMAIVATHSPVVLQEVPKSCVWKLHRSGHELSAEPPMIETFGENVGTLTDEIFGLEVTATGFHRMLSEVAMEARDYDSAVAAFDGQLGAEGRAILRTMINRARRESHVES